MAGAGSGVGECPWGQGVRELGWSETAVVYLSGSINVVVQITLARSNFGLSWVG